MDSIAAFATDSRFGIILAVGAIVGAALLLYRRQALTRTSLIAVLVVALAVGGLLVSTLG